VPDFLAALSSQSGTRARQENQITHSLGRGVTADITVAGDAGRVITPNAYDTIVVGSGAAGLSAALTSARAGLNTVVLERTALLGGTTAMSGGLFYVPNSRLARDAGFQIDRAKIVDYLESVARRPIDQHLLHSFLDAAPAMLDELAASGIRLRLTGVLDYYRNKSTSPGGHVVGTEDFDPAELDEWGSKIRHSPYRDTSTQPWTNGMSLVGHLVAAGLRAGVEYRINTDVTTLVQTADGAITGVTTRDSAGAVLSGRGVVLATGGFEFNPELMEEYFGRLVEGSWSCPGNTGVALLVARQVGAALDGLGEVQWYPLLRLSEDTVEGGPLFHDASPARNLPGSMVVDRTGRRFVNESTLFQDFGRAIAISSPARLPTWLVVDQAFADMYGLRAFGTENPSSLSGVHTRETLDELAIAIGVPVDALTATVERFNVGAVKGKDPDFGRGEAAVDREWGDMDKPDGFACLAPISRGPFQATRIYSGSSGTTGGPKVDGNARVIRPDGTPVRGLYAGGNAIAGLFGDSSPASGATLGPGLTFGYLAAKTIAERGDALAVR
jgi:3-oxosteroid 1-dehydrogenase